MDERDKSHNDDEIPGLNDDTIKDTPVVGLYTCLFMIDNAPKC